MLLREFVLSAREKLSTIYPESEANAIAGALCTEFLDVQAYSFMLEPAMQLKEARLSKALAALDRLMKNEPLQYVLGYAEFYGNRFNVSPSVLIPRPETEELCRHAIDRAMQLYRSRSVYGSKAAPVRILDLCTGSGCIAWTMAANVPGSRVVAVDISAGALEVASSQKIDIPKDRKPIFVQADVLDTPALKEALDGELPFDIIISNPPYVMDSERAKMRNNVLDYEPELALFVPDADPLIFYRKIADLSVSLSETDISGFLEINEALGSATAGIFKEKGFKNVEIQKDLSGKERFVFFGK